MSFTVTMTRNGKPATRPVMLPSLDAVRWHVLTECLPVTLTVREAVRLLDDLAGGGAVSLQDGTVIEVTRS